MRPLVEPPPSTRCDRCGGELRFKELIEPAGGILGLDQEIFICIKCGHEQVCVVSHDHYEPHTKAS